jgi:hypothetical protein
VNPREFEEFIQKYPEYKSFFHFVHTKRGDYWRRIPKTYLDRSARPVSQLRSQLHFAQIAHRQYGKRGSKEQPLVVAPAIKKEMSGKRYRRPRWKETVRQLKESLKQVGVVVAETRSLERKNSMKKP